MDLLQEAAVKDTVDVILKRPGTDIVIENDDGTPMTVTLYGPYSKTYRSATIANRNKYLSMLKGDQLDAEQADEMMFDLLVKCIAAWDITAGGEKPKLTEKKARDILEKLPTIKDQLSLALNNIEGFLGNSETT